MAIEIVQFPPPVARHPSPTHTNTHGGGGSGSGNRTRGAAVWPCHNTTHHAVTHHPSPVAHPHQHLRRWPHRQPWRWARGHCAPQPVCFFFFPNRYENTTKTNIIIIDLKGHHHHYHHLPPGPSRPSP